MGLLITLVAFFVILLVAILVHEFGHFVSAKASGVTVEEFGIGLPPRIWGFKKGETLYSINWLPIGGFCKMAGEEDPDVPGGLGEKSIKTRFLVLGAGSLLMLLLPLFLLPAAYMMPMERPLDDGGVRVDSISVGSPAEAAGLQAGDIFVSIDGQAVKTFDEIHDIVDNKAGTEVTLLLLRDGAEFETSLVPRAEEETPEGQGAMGVGMKYLTETRYYPFWQAIPRGLRDYGDVFVGIKNAIGSLVSGEASVKDAVAGPVGIAQLTGEVAELGIEPLIRLAALICIILGIVNLLPIPGLDGGRLVFVAIEGLRRGKRISAQRENMVHLIGFAFLLALMVLVTYNDILRLIRGESFFP